MRKLTDIEWDKWHPTERATLLFVVRDGKVLLIHKKRGLGAGKINGPGGRIEEGETPEQCAIREVQEELHIAARNVVWTGNLKFQFVDGFSIECEVFRTSDYDGTPTETNEAKPEWFDVANPPYDRMWADDRVWLPLMLDSRKFRGRFVFDGDTMLDAEIRETSNTEHSTSNIQV